MSDCEAFVSWARVDAVWSWSQKPRNKCGQHGGSNRSSCVASRRRCPTCNIGASFCGKPALEDHGACFNRVFPKVWSCGLCRGTFTGSPPHQICINNEMQRNKRDVHAVCVQIVRNKSTGQSKGYGFVSFAAPASAAAAASATGEHVSRNC